MILALRAALTLAGGFFVLLGLSFLFDPSSQGASFGLSPMGNQGLSSIRGDFLAYFALSGGAMVIGAWRRNGDLLLVAASLLGLTFLGRAYSLVVDGTYEAWFAPMTVEAIAVIITLIGSRVLPHSALTPDE